jgi:hypothetical protein
MLLTRKEKNISRIGRFVVNCFAILIYIRIFMLGVQRTCMHCYFRCKLWVKNTRRADLLGKNVADLNTKGYYLCANHFEPSQFTIPAERKRLNWNAVPTLFDVPNPPPRIEMKRPAPKERKSGEPPQKKCRRQSDTGMLFNDKLLTCLKCGL